MHAVENDKQEILSREKMIIPSLIKQQLINILLIR